MSRKFLTALDLGKNELQNPRAHQLGAAPSSPVTGQIYYNTGDNTLYWWDGTQWVSARGGAIATPPATTTTLGTIQLAGDLTGTATAPTVANGAITSAKIADGTIAIADFGSGVRLDTIAAPTGPVNINNQRLTSVADPTAGTDGANKNYVDNLISGLAWSDTVRVATTANITLSGLTAIDGVTPVAGDRVLVKNQTNGQENGVYVAASGAWSRATDADSESELLNMALWVSQGTTQADTAWVMTTDSPITVGTTPLTWVQFSGAGMLNAGAGLTKTGNTLDVGAGSGIAVLPDSIAVDAAVVALLASPNFSGDPRVPTATPGDNDTTIANTAFVTAAISASVVKRFAQNVGGAVSQALVHNFNTRDLEVAVYRNASPWDTVDCDEERTDLNTVTLRFTTAPAANEFRAVILA